MPGWDFVTKNNKPITREGGGNSMAVNEYWKNIFPNFEHLMLLTNVTPQNSVSMATSEPLKEIAVSLKLSTSKYLKVALCFTGFFPRLKLVLKSTFQQLLLAKS